jgi:uncharacterized membrane protein
VSAVLGMLLLVRRGRCKLLVGGKKVLEGSKKIGCGPFVWPKSKLASVPTI